MNVYFRSSFVNILQTFTVHSFCGFSVRVDVIFGHQLILGLYVYLNNDISRFAKGLILLSSQLVSFEKCHEHTRTLPILTRGHSHHMCTNI